MSHPRMFKRALAACCRFSRCRPSPLSPWPSQPAPLVTPPPATEVHGGPSITLRPSITFAELEELSETIDLEGMGETVFGLTAYTLPKQKRF